MLEAVGTEGYARTSVRVVLDRTGLYRQAFYDNFGGKLDCYLQAYDAEIERTEALVAAAVEGAETWQEELREGMRAVLRLLDESPDVGRALIVEVHAAGREATTRRDEIVRRFGEYLKRTGEAAGGGAPSIAPEAVAAGIHSVLHSRLANHEDGALLKLLPEFMYIAVLPYFGVEAARTEMRAARS